MEKKLSLIIPCYNEEQVISQTADTVIKKLDEFGYSFELIFVNDGSTDGTLTKLCEISKKDDRVKYISFSRNFGKESAMLAGLEASEGDMTIIMDADLQHPPELIPTLIQKYEEGYDQVVACRDREGDSLCGTFFAKLYYKMVNSIIDVKLYDGAGDFRLLSRRAVDSLIALKENNRFSKGLFSWIGYPTAYIKYKNRERVGGITKWSFKRLFNYGIDGIVSFNNKPLRCSMLLGAAFIVISIIYLLYMLISMIMGNALTSENTTVLLICGLCGTQLFSLGVIGEYIGRIYYEVKRRPTYIISETNIKK